MLDGPDAVSRPMTAMTSWNAVKDNADEQRKTAAKTARQGTIGIGALYPELYKPWIKSFSNNIGTHLIPDILTSPCVLVDLYNWPAASELIKVYGIDLNFLLDLRDNGHVILCANLPPERYVESTWLHSTLADQRTIFRSVRTPLFFESKQKDFSAKSDKFKLRIKRHLEHRSSADIEKLAKLIKPAHPLNGIEDVAEVLSYWGKRLAVLNPDTEPMVAELETRPEKVIKEIRQRQFFDVSPITAGLGGYVRQDISSLHDKFPDRLDMEALPEKIRVSITNLNAFVAKLVTGVEVEDLSNEEFWNGLAKSKTKRKDLLKVLDNREERAEAIKAEEWMRKTLMRAGNEKWTEQQITQYANDQIESWDKLSQSKNLSVAAASLVALVIGELDTAAYIGAIGFGSEILGNTISGPVVEGLIPKIQFVRFVRRHQK